MRVLRSLSRTQSLAAANKAPAQGTASDPLCDCNNTVRVVSGHQRWAPAVEGIWNTARDSHDDMTLRWRECMTLIPQTTQPQLPHRPDVAKAKLEDQGSKSAGIPRRQDDEDNCPPTQPPPSSSPVKLRDRASMCGLKLRAAA